MEEPVIALDAMGGDNAPAEIVKGAVQAAQALGVRVALVGRGEASAGARRRIGWRPDGYGVVRAAGVIGMEEHRGRAARHKKDSSIAVGLKLVKRGEAQAFV